MELPTEVVTLYGCMTSQSVHPCAISHLCPLTWKQTWISSGAIVFAAEQKPQ